MATPQGAADASTGPLRLKWFRRMLTMFPVGTLVDLGAGHGNFSLEAAEAGWRVTAVDARSERFPKDPRVTWTVGDIRETDVNAFDVIACLGLFYHLTAEDQIGLLGRCSGTPIILDTHVANDRPSPFELSDPVSQLGYRGRLFREPDLSSRLASWGNEKSFWPRPRALYRMLDDHGYDVLTAQPWYLPTRTFFLCLPR